METDKDYQLAMKVFNGMKENDEKVKQENIKAALLALKVAYTGKI